MHRFPLLRCVVVAASVFASAAGARAHVTLPPGGATVGTDYSAAFHVGHACAGAGTTTGIRVRLPEGFMLLAAEPRAGWTLIRTPADVSWTAATPQAALPTAERADFVLRGRLPPEPGTLWFKVLQTCDMGSADWAEIPTSEGHEDAGRFPAARLDVLPAGVAAVAVQGAWARPAVAGQSGAGVFARLTAPAGARLVAASTPVAATAAVHEMRMDGDVMRMRPLEGGLELPPGKPVELGPGGYHLMLGGISQPLVLGRSFPLTLRFVDRRGEPGSLDVQVEVKSGPPAAGEAHRH